MPEFYIILARIPDFFMIFSRKNNKFPEFYMIFFARKIPEFYIIIVRKIFFPIWGGRRVRWGGHVPSVSYA